MNVPSIPDFVPGFFCETYRTDILSIIFMSTNSHSGPPAEIQRR
jgi:hypothetical protein